MENNRSQSASLVEIVMYLIAILPKYGYPCLTHQLVQFITKKLKVAVYDQSGSANEYLATSIFLWKRKIATHLQNRTCFKLITVLSLVHFLPCSAITQAFDGPRRSSRTHTPEYMAAQQECIEQERQTDCELFHDREYPI